MICGQSEMFRPAQHLKPSRGILAAAVAVVVLPSIMLVALGIRLLDQDHALEERRRRELAESVLDRAVSAMQKDIAVTQRQLVQRSVAEPVAEFRAQVGWTKGQYEAPCARSTVLLKWISKSTL